MLPPRRATALIAGLVALAVAVPFGESAVRSNVKLKLSKDGTAIQGRVKSKGKRCKRNRKVKLQTKERGLYRKTGRTNRKGRYRLEGPGGPMPPARYFVTAFRKRGCPSAKSETLRVK